MEREVLMYKAKLADRAERYTDMVDIMKRLVSMDIKITPDERNMLSIAFKNDLATKRLAWKVLSSVEQNEVQPTQKHLKVIREYRKEIENEIDTVCAEVLNIVDKALMPKTDNKESKIYYLKMKGDYYRYMAEILSGYKRTEFSENATVAYKEATELAVNELSPIHPIRLGLALNFSVFFYDILNSAERACRLARVAFDDAVAELDVLTEDLYYDSTLILQLLRDNLTLWSQEVLVQN